MKKNKLYVLISIIILLLAILLFLYFIINNASSVNNSKTENLNTEYNTSENNNQLNYKFFVGNLIPYDDMQYFNNIYYKQLNSLDEYNSFKSKVSSLPECETDFDKNFNVVIMTENISTQYFIPYKVYNENNTLHIGLIKDINTNPESNAIILELSKSLEKDNIEPYASIDEDIPYPNYTPIKELPKEYSLENAKNDNCYVTQNGGIILNQHLAEEFINNYNNSEDAFIRKVQFSDEGELITDIYYSSTENKFLVCIDSSRIRKDSTYNYYEYSNLEKKTLDVGKNGTTDFYSLTNSYEESLSLFNI